MANYLFKNPGKGKRRPPKEWFYYTVERVKQKLKKRGFKHRPGSPYKTIPQVAKAIVGGMWWGTTDGLHESTKRDIISEVIKNRAKGKAAVVTSDGTLTKKEVKSEVGKKAAESIYKKLKLTKTEIKEAKQLKRGVPAIERIAERRMVAPNPSLLVVTGNPGIDLHDKGNPPSLEDFKEAYPELWKAAMKQYKKFHGVVPETVQMQWVDSDVPPILIKMGDAPDVTYHVKGASKKQKKIPFKHDYKGVVHVCTDANGRMIFHIPDAKKGKNVKVTDWVRG